MKLLIIGHGRHGKDTVAEIINEEYGLTFMSSSLAAAEAIRPILANEYGLKYQTLDECYEDRHNHRQAWKDAISRYNEEDRTRLARHILARSDVYVGLRCDVEFYAARHLFDYVIGVTAFDRIKTLDPTFMIPLSECDFIIENDGDEDDLRQDVVDLMERFIL